MEQYSSRMDMLLVLFDSFVENIIYNVASYVTEKTA